MNDRDCLRSIISLPCHFFCFYFLSSIFRLLPLTNHQKLGCTKVATFFKEVTKFFRRRDHITSHIYIYIYILSYCFLFLCLFFSFLLFRKSMILLNIYTLVSFSSFCMRRSLFSLVGSQQCSLISWSVSPTKRSYVKQLLCILLLVCKVSGSWISKSK